MVYEQWQHFKIVSGKGYIWKEKKHVWLQAINVPVDDLTLLATRASAYRMMAKFTFSTFMAIERFKFEFLYFPQKYKYVYFCVTLKTHVGLMFNQNFLIGFVVWYLDFVNFQSSHIAINFLVAGWR